MVIASSAGPIAWSLVSLDYVSVISFNLWKGGNSSPKMIADFLSSYKGKREIYLLWKQTRPCAL